jgi:uncharacterized protein (TIGR02594 family)
VNVTAFDVAKRFLDVEEVEGMASNPLVLAMLKLDARWPKDDATPWCSAFVNFVAWLLGLPRSKSLAARSWLLVGEPIELFEARQSNDVVILKRGSGNQPGPAEINAPGHVGFFAGRAPGEVIVLGGNQGNQVSIQRYPSERVIGVRRLAS